MDLDSLDAMSIARDGTGGLVYLKNVGGVPHVFLSRLLGGSFGAPQQLDAGLTGASSQPVIAAASGGLMLLSWVNGGQVYVAQSTAAAQPVGPPTPLAAGTNPALSISPSGKGYLVYTGADQVDFAYWAQGGWTAGSGPLDATATDAAGVGSDRPQVATGGDGIGIAVWGEGGHVYVRRLDATTPSVEVQSVDPPSVDGFSEVSATRPVVGCVGYSTYAALAFSETIASGSQRQTRVIYNRLHAEYLDGAVPADGANSGGSQNGDEAAVAVTEFGGGLLTTETSGSHQLDAGLLGPSSALAGLSRVDSLPNTAAPDAAPASAGVYSAFLAWQQTPGVAGPAEIRLRYAPNGTDLGPEQVISNPAAGPTDADAGLVDGGDLAGDAAVAWVQDAPAGPEIVSAQLSQPPGAFAPAYTSHYVASLYPTLAWSTSAESWGGVTYSLSLDGAALPPTAATSVRPGPVAQGRHVWQVSAINRSGLTSTARSATVFVDTLHPRSSFTLRGSRTTGASLTLRDRATDRVLAGLPASTASGVSQIVLRWGDGTVRRATKPFTATHAYRRAGRYRIRVTATDRAGNHTTAVRRIRIVASGGGGSLSLASTAPAPAR